MTTTGEGATEILVRHSIAAIKATGDRVNFDIFGEKEKTYNPSIFINANSNVEQAINMINGALSPTCQDIIKSKPLMSSMHFKYISTKSRRTRKKEPLVIVDPGGNNTVQSIIKDSDGTCTIVGANCHGDVRIVVFNSRGITQGESYTARQFYRQRNEIAKHFGMSLRGGSSKGISIPAI